MNYEHYYRRCNLYGPHFVCSFSPYNKYIPNYIGLFSSHLIFLENINFIEENAKMLNFTGPVSLCQDFKARLQKAKQLKTNESLFSEKYYKKNSKFEKLSSYEFALINQESPNKISINNEEEYLSFLSIFLSIGSHQKNPQKYFEIIRYIIDNNDFDISHFIKKSKVRKSISLRKQTEKYLKSLMNKDINIHDFILKLIEYLELNHENKNIEENNKNDRNDKKDIEMPGLFNDISKGIFCNSKYIEETLLISMRSTLIDDVEKLQSICTTTTFDINYKFSFNFREMDCFKLSAKNGAVKCFKYIMLNHNPSFRDVFQYAIEGGNFELVHICYDQIQGSRELQDGFDKAVELHKNDIIEWLLMNHSNKIINLNFFLCAKNGNFEMLEKIYRKIKFYKLNTFERQNIEYRDEYDRYVLIFPAVLFTIEFVNIIGFQCLWKAKKFCIFSFRMFREMLHSSIESNFLEAFTKVYKYMKSFYGVSIFRKYLSFFETDLLNYAISFSFTNDISLHLIEQNDSSFFIDKRGPRTGVIL